MVSLVSPVGTMLPPPTPKSLSQRPSIGLKRDSSYLDGDDEAGLSSTTKKLKVAFSPTVDVRIVDDWTEKSFELVKEEVRIGIERHIAPGDRQDDTQYAKLLQTLNQDVRSDEAASSKLLKKYLLALDAKVNSLRECGKIVNAILDMAWLGRDDTFGRLYLKLLCSLATAHPKFVPLIMDKLVSYFHYLPAALGRLPQEIPISRAEMFSRVHTAIQTLLHQIPSAIAALVKALKLGFPNDLATTRSYIQYQRQMLRVTAYAPEINAELLALLIQRLVSIDVDIQQDLEDLDEEVEASLLQLSESKDVQIASDESEVDSLSESEESMTQEESRAREFRLKVAKMDGMLDMLFDFYTPLIQPPGVKPSVNEGYRQLLAHSTSFVMPNRTRHAQVLLFHFSQTSPAHVAMLVQQYLDIALQPNFTTSSRVTACAYLSSYIARGAHVPAGTVKLVFDALCHHLEGMRQRYEPYCRGPDKRAYGLYYSVAQALLYIFCFRWRDLLTSRPTNEVEDEVFSEDDLVAEGGELSWIPAAKEILPKNIYCHLNPLKVCSPAIVAEFAKIAHHLRFMYVFSLLETNKRLRLGHVPSYHSSNGTLDIAKRETAWDRKTGEAHFQLEVYFPFDPYHLPNSKKWVEGDYNEWRLPAGLRKAAEADEYSDSDDEDDSANESLLEDIDDLPTPDSISVSS